MNARYQERLNRLLPGGKPRYVRIYDHPDFGDRYTVVYTGHFRDRNYQCHVRVMSGNPFHPLGVGMYEIYDKVIDYPTYGHLGKKISFDDLPEDCQKLVLQDYKDLWELEWEGQA